MVERRVWIAQCLCGPNRHAIAAAATEADSEPNAESVLLPQLRRHVATLLQSGINPWCGICGAEQPGWRYEVARTAFGTMEEAGPTLAGIAVSNALGAALYGTHAPTRPGSG